MTVYGSRAFIPTAKYLHSLSLPLSFRVPKGGGGGNWVEPGSGSSSLGRSAGERETFRDNFFSRPAATEPGELSLRLAPPNVNTLFLTSSYIVLLY